LLKFSCKITSFTKATLKSSRVSVAVVIAWTNTHHFPKKFDKIAIFLVENICQNSAKPITFQQNLPRKFPPNRLFLPIVFQLNSPLKFPRISLEISHFFCKIRLFFCDLSEALDRVGIFAV